MVNLTNNSNGTVLVVVLIIITVLTALAVSFSHETAIELNLVEYSRDSYKALLSARSGANVAMALIHQDEDTDVDSLDENWATFSEEAIPWDLEEDTSLKGSIVDESSKFNLNELIVEDGEAGETNAQRVKRIFSALGLETSQADPIIDWLDADDTEYMEGAEKLYYEALDIPYTCTNGPLLTIAQLHLVKGISEIIKNLEKEDKNLFDYFTIYGDGKININTAPVEVLQSLDEEINADLAQAIIEYRENDPYTQESDLKNVIGIDDALYNNINARISVKSSFFSIHMNSIYRTSASEINAIVQREGDDIRIVYWQAK